MDQVEAGGFDCERRVRARDFHGDRRRIAGAAGSGRGGSRLTGVHLKRSLQGAGRGAVCRTKCDGSTIFEGGVVGTGRRGFYMPLDLRPFEDLPRLRAQFAAPDEKLVLLVGRLVYEKGFHLALDAMPRLIDRLGAFAQETGEPVTVVLDAGRVVGNGTHLPALPPDVERIELPHNLGVSGGRNAAAASAPSAVSAVSTS